MKAEIKRYNNQWYWVIYYRNGLQAVEGRYYTRYGNAKRGLRNFVEKMWTTVGIEKIMDAC